MVAQLTRFGLRMTIRLQIAILPSRDLLVIMKSRLPFYHLQNSLFSTKF